MQYREGDIIIGVLASVHNRGPKICNKIIKLGFEEVETVNLVVDMVSCDYTIGSIDLYGTAYQRATRTESANLLCFAGRMNSSRLPAVAKLYTENLLST